MHRKYLQKPCKGGETKLKKFIAVILTGFIILSATIAYAGYTTSDGTKVTWLGGNQIQVTKPDGSTYTTTGIMTPDGHLVPPQLADSSGKINTTITTDNGQTSQLTVTPGYSINGTNYYYNGTTSSLITISNGQVDTVPAERMGDRVVPTSVHDPKMAAAIQQVITATGGWFNYNGSTFDGNGDGSQSSGGRVNPTNSTMLGDATIVGDGRTVKVQKPDGTILQLNATEFQNGWADKGAYVIPYSTLDQSTIDYLKNAGFMYDDKSGVFIMQFTKQIDTYSGVNWTPKIGQVLTGDPSIDDAITDILQNKYGIDVYGNVVGNLSMGSDVMTQLRNLYQQITATNPDPSLFTNGSMGDILEFIKDNPTYQDFVNNVLNYATRSGVAMITIPGDTSTGSTSTTPTQYNNPPTVNPPPSSGSTTTNNPPPVKQLTADDVHATITINKTPNFVYTKWHTDENGYPAYMDITIKWKNVEIGSVVDTPGGTQEVRTPAYVSNVTALHNIHRYTNNIIASDNWETEYPVMQNIDLANNQATFRFMYRKAGQEDSTLYFKLYLNGTDKYFCVYVHIPVNGFNATLFNDGKDHSNPGFKTSNPNSNMTNIQTETITF